MAVKDITLLENDLYIINGDFSVQESDSQHIELIIDSWLGSWKQFPLCGVGIENYVKSSGQSLALKRSISVQLEADGFNSIDIYISPYDILDVTVDATRNV
jgi:hypothetical protein